MSDWFCEMSRGQFDFIGDEIYFQLPEESSYYQQLGWKRGELNRYILQYVDQNLGVNYSRYDKWTETGNSWQWGSDGIAEMIIIKFRNIPYNYESYYWSIEGGGHGIGGEAHLWLDGGSPLTFDGTQINANTGITATQGLYRTTRVELVIEHEVCHHIFGYYFNHPDINPAHVCMGMMHPGHGGSTYCMLPMESSMPGLDYTVPSVLDPDVSVHTRTLGDFIETGNTVKIPIPKPIPSAPQEYFWLSNHKKVSKYDGVSRGSKTCAQINKYEQDPFCDVGKGLFIFHERSTNCGNSYNDGKRYPFDLVNADGRWNWEIDRQVYSSFHAGNLYIYRPFTKSLFGPSEFNKFKLLSTQWSAQLLTDNPCSNEIQDFFVTGDFHGDGLDAYNVGYDEIFSPYSNPSTNTCFNPSTNSGLTVRLTNQNSFADIDVIIYYDDALALFECPPSKPKNVKATKLYFGYAGSDSFHPKINWDANVEPDFLDPHFGAFTTEPVYEIYRGNSTNCGAEPSYYFLASVSNNVTQYIDYGVTLHDPDIDAPSSCPLIFTTYSYKIVAKDNRGMSSLKSERGLVFGYWSTCAEADGPDNLINNNLKPENYFIGNYPNPFNPISNIKFDLPVDVFVSLKIYDALGKEIAILVNEFKNGGRYDVTFNGANFPSGVYYCKINAGSFEQIRKMVLIK
jgi:hypothetical protein